MTHTTNGTKRRIRVILQHVDSPKGVGKRIRDRRAELEISQRELAFPGCTAAYLSRVEKGDRIPSLQLLEEIALRLDVPTSWLARGTDDGAEPDLERENARLQRRVETLERRLDRIQQIAGA